MECRLVRWTSISISGCHFQLVIRLTHFASRAPGNQTTIGFEPRLSSTRRIHQFRSFASLSGALNWNPFFFSFSKSHVPRSFFYFVFRQIVTINFPLSICTDLIAIVVLIDTEFCAILQKCSTFHSTSNNVCIFVFCLRCLHSSSSLV